MKRHFLFLSLLLFSLSVMGETYTIVFNSGNADSSSPTSELTNIVLSATYNCVGSIRTANKIYRAKDGYGIKGGTGSAKGELTIGLDNTYHISSMTVYAAAYVPANGADTAANKRLLIYNQEIAWEAGHRAEIRPYEIMVNADVDSIYIGAKVATNNRWYVQKIEFEAEDPMPNTAVFEMPYTVDFGSTPVEDSIPAEDVVQISVKGKHVIGTIHLGLQKGTVFSLGRDTLPAEGGDVDIAYSLSFTGTAEDMVLISGRGADGIEVTKRIPIKISGYKYTPPTFEVDSSKMAFGPMSGRYYMNAQGTQDSVLKSRLGEIIFSGIRYRYGSGARKTWDGFYHTDRDTTNNQVMDMYSDNIRYFNPENPTASVAGFDIEHMLPKSWWGGTVNEAYCDLFHLVPGDYSANRSKSNHAPGIPSDTTFWNGSFATGSGEAYGLQKVFCPADEYKGDFARAYFYIACCYGDSLTWVESGDASVAMTNDNWQEFKPWLRDVLLSWHRMDPVSEKEKSRAIEVNKIQGNRNPFIDYPELVEFIWGERQGEAVDFNQLEQSFGDPYDEKQGIYSPEGENTSIRKEIRDGQVVIIRNSSVYTTLGQKIR